MVDMMIELGPDSFAPTQRNLNAGSGGNLNPRRAIMRKPHMELTPQAYKWIFDRAREVSDAVWRARSHRSALRPTGGARQLPGCVCDRPTGANAVSRGVENGYTARLSSAT